MRETQGAGPMLVVNAGSATIKLDLFGIEATGLARLRRRTFDIDVGDPNSILSAFIADGGHGLPIAVVHRIVHGGQNLRGAAVIDRRNEASILAAAPLAPLHNPTGLAWVRASRELAPKATQIAVPDTGFFADLPPRAARYALPRPLSDEFNLRRHGFHGTAHQAMIREWQSQRSGGTGKARLITLQLGSGCSVTASEGGRAIDTSMGFTPMEGLVMATRAGDVDPGLLIHLLRQGRLDTYQLERLLNQESGLLGLAGSADMRTVLAADTPEAAEAIDIYCHRVRKYLGAYLAVLGGADAILFGGGVGENSPTIRSRILSGFDWAGIRFDGEANSILMGQSGRFEAQHTSVELHVVAVDEATQLATLALPLVS